MDVGKKPWLRNLKGYIRIFKASGVMKEGMARLAPKGSKQEAKA